MLGGRVWIETPDLDHAHKFMILKDWEVQVKVLHTTGKAA